MTKTLASISCLRRDLDTKKISSVELTNSSLAAIARLNPHLNAYISVTSDLALTQAKHADKLIKSGQQTALTGIPFCLKDAYVTPDTPTTAGSQILSEFHSPYSATVYQRLLDQAAVLVGKNNQDSWGHGGTNTNSDFGPCKNPYNLDHVSGGSSGGTAAALAARTAFFGIGEDTGGSIRNPASFCNVSGLKVTYGRVSRYGAIAYASSLDTVGPMANSVEDLAWVLNTIAGHDLLDASSSHHPVPDYTANLTASLKGKTIGIITQNQGKHIDSATQSTLTSALKQFEALGCNITQVSLPTLQHGVSIYFILALSETSSNLARYDGIRYGKTRALFSNESSRRILTGTYALSAGYYDAFYKKALKARTQLIQEFNQAFQSADLLISPTVPHPAPPLDSANHPTDPMAEYLADQLTCPVNVVGLPALSLPAGFTTDNLPIGVQLIAPTFSESLLLNAGYLFQQVTNYHQQLPNL